MRVVRWGRCEFGVVYVMYICFVLERVSEALGWFDTGASGTAGLMYSVGMVKSK